MHKNIPLMIVLAASLTACGGGGGSDSKKSSSSVALSSTPASVAASSEAASSAPAVSSTPASSVAASSEPASSVAASSEPASSVAASSEPASSSSQASSSSAAAFDGTFTNQNSISFWSTSPNWNTPTGTATQAIVDGALVITPTWTAVTDAFNVEATLPHSLDVTGATISLKVYVPEAYVVDGKLAVQIYFKNADGKLANGGWKEADWGPWRWSGSETGSTTNVDGSFKKFGWATIAFTVTAAGLDDINDTTDTPKWGYDQGLDITKVTHFGIEITSKNKPINVTGEIKFDDVVLPGL